MSNENEQASQPDTGNRIVFVILGAALILGIIAAVVGLVLSNQNTTPEAEADTEYAGTVFDPPVPVLDFSLPSNSGDDLSLSELSGEGWTLMFFGYTHCPDFCPTTMADFRQVKRILGDDAESVNFLFVSVDGERDTPELLNRFVRRFDPTFIGMSGDPETLETIQPDYGLFYQLRKDLATDERFYVVDHSTRSYLIGPDLHMHASYAYNTDPIIMAESIQAQIQAES